MNSKHGTSIKTDLEPETFKPNLREPSDLLEADQIEKVESSRNRWFDKHSQATCPENIEM